MSLVNPLYSQTISPPVMEARRWLRETPLPEGLALLNLSQAAPTAPPPEELRKALAEIILNQPSAHFYGPVLGLGPLREEIATQWRAIYRGEIRPGQVAITSGCNQAFTSVVPTLAGRGDAILLPAPWYFNHKMWLDMEGIETRILHSDESLLPDPVRADALIDAKVKAIVLVSPNNPCGVEYPPALIKTFYKLAKAHGIALIIDETYRDFLSKDGPAHCLFEDPHWPETLIQLYSFSKAYRLTGHRVGALIAAESRLTEVEKFLDANTICPNQPAQYAALWGLQNLSQWLQSERAEILSRRVAIESGMKQLKNWSLLGLGAYFAFLQHPFALSSDALVKVLLTQEAVLTLPGTIFGPTKNHGGNGLAEATIRIAFANANRAQIEEMFKRLARLDLEIRI